MTSTSISDDLPSISDTALDSALRKATRRVAWFVVLIYFVAVLDRVNIGFAALTMNKALGLSSTVFGLGASLFLVGYIIFEIPSNLMLAKIGARRWLSRIAVTWGLMTVAMAAVVDQTSFLIVRFMIGAAEAGAFPGIMLLLTLWFPQSHRARLNAVFLLSIPLTNAVSSPLAGLLIGLDGKLGLAGWQWLFIIEGALSVAVGLITWVYLSDQPATASWLTPEEKRALESKLAEERRLAGVQPATSLWASLTSWPVIVIGLMYSGISLSLTTAAFWLPQVVRSTGLSTGQSSIATAIPFVLGAAAMVFWGRQSDRRNERFFHTLIPALIASVGWAIAAFASGPVPLVAAVSLAAIGHFSATAVLWTLPARFLAGTGAAAGMALISAIANIASAFGPPIIGMIRDATGAWTYGLLLVSVYMLITPVCVLVLRKLTPKQFS